MIINDWILNYLVWDDEEGYNDPANWEGILELDGLSDKEIEASVNDYLDRFCYKGDEMYDYDLYRGYITRDVFFTFDGELYGCSYSEYDGYLELDDKGECFPVESYNITETKYRRIYD